MHSPPFRTHENGKKYLYDEASVLVLVIQQTSSGLHPSICLTHAGCSSAKDNENTLKVIEDIYQYLIDPSMDIPAIFYSPPIFPFRTIFYPLPLV